MFSVVESPLLSPVSDGYVAQQPVKKCASIRDWRGGEGRGEEEGGHLAVLKPRGGLSAGTDYFMPPLSGGRC